MLQTGPIFGITSYLFEELLDDQKNFDTGYASRNLFHLPSEKSLRESQRVHSRFRRYQTLLETFEGESTFGGDYVAQIEWLRACNNILTLRIIAINGINFTILATAFPLLEHIYIGDCFENSGTLEGLSRSQVNDSGQPRLKDAAAVFPMNSIHCLTRLRLDFFLCDADEFDIDPIGKFTELKDLCVEPLSDTVCASIMNANSYLTSCRAQSVLLHYTVDMPIYSHRRASEV